jgi:uncharacterized membrane protein
MLWAPAVPISAQQYQGFDLFTLQIPPGQYTVGQLGGFSQYTASGGQVVGYVQPGQGRIGGLLWTAPSGALLDFTPAFPLGNSTIEGTDGVSQVGVLDFPGSPSHAVLWSGSPDSVVDLHPAGHSGTASVAFGVSGTQQVGEINARAFLWNGSAETAVSLHPLHLGGFDRSAALATDGVSQVGYLANSQIIGRHAALWHGSAKSALDLAPTGFLDSVAYGVGGDQQVGVGSFLDGRERALLWTGSAESVVDLHPSSLSDHGSSRAFATNGTMQVGGGDLGALLWKGTAASAVDLNSLLPSGLGASVALSIGFDGVIYGLAYDSLGRTHAVMWNLVPEPDEPCVSIFIAIGLAIGRPWTTCRDLDLLVITVFFPLIP